MDVIRFLMLIMFALHLCSIAVIKASPKFVYAEDSLNNGALKLFLEKYKLFHG